MGWTAALVCDRLQSLTWKHAWLIRSCFRGGVAQLVRAPACHAGGRGFKSRLSRQYFNYLAINFADPFRLGNPRQLELFRLCSLHLRPRFLALVRRAHGLQVDRRIRLPQEGGFIELVAIFAAIWPPAAPPRLDRPQSPKIGEPATFVGPEDRRTDIAKSSPRVSFEYGAPDRLRKMGAAGASSAPSAAKYASSTRGERRPSVPIAARPVLGADNVEGVSPAITARQAAHIDRPQARVPGNGIAADRPL